MRIISRFQGMARRALGISPTDDYWFSPLGTSTYAGKKVSDEQALRLAVVYACIRILSEAVSTLPLHLYRKTSEGRERLDKHPAMRLIATPHPQMTKIRWRETMQHHMLSQGNAYSYIVGTNRGTYDRAILLNPTRITIESDGKDGYQYLYSSKNGRIPLETENVLHLSGLGYDGRKGYSPLTMAREAIGLGLACEEFAGRFFGNGTHPGSILEHPGKLSPDARERLTRDFKKAAEGLGKSHKAIILEEGMTFKQPGIPLNDAQFLEQRKFQNSEIAAKIYLVPPHKVGELDRATFSNIEQQDLEFYKSSLMAWLKRWEEELGAFFFAPEERETYYFEHDTAALLRGDTKSRFEAYHLAWQDGWINHDEIRAKENMSPKSDGQGKTYYIPLNMVPTTQPRELKEQSRSIRIETRSLAIKNRLRSRYGPLFRNAADKIVQREARAIKRAVGKHLTQRSKEDFNLWIDEFYGALPQHIKREFQAVYLSYGEAVQEAVADSLRIEHGLDEKLQRFISDYQDTFAARHVSSSKGQLRALMRDTEEALLADAILERAESWAETSPDKIAANEVVRFSGAITRTVFVASGITKLKWIRQGSKSCPYCTELDGKIVGIEKPFVDEGDFEPEGADGPLAVAGATFHPPLHQGCICDIQAE